MNPTRITSILFLFLSITPILAQQSIKRNPGSQHIEGTRVSQESDKNKSASPENIDPNELVVIDKSGDASMAIPIVTVKGRSLSLPIQAGYKAGIKADQKSSEIGLGWNIAFGSITRDYGAFEPDYSYTGSETSMLNYDYPNAGIGNLSNPKTTGTTLATANLKNMDYNGIKAGSVTPDNYNLVIPGVGGNSFWNNGTAGGTHNFVLSDVLPWKIAFELKTYEIDQEFSRINEINFRQVGPPVLDNGYNLSAAIAIPPYVPHREFSKYVPPYTNTAPTNPFNSSTFNKVKYEDFKSFTITTEIGTKYIFGRALRGQKYLFSDDPFWSSIPESYKAQMANGGDPQATYGEWWKIDYIAEWLLTEIRSNDFVDVNLNGIADDGDEGDWIRIEYTEPYQIETPPGLFPTLVPKHREWDNFSQTDKASSLMRERAYVTRIVTPVEQVDFTTSKRFDVDHDYFKTTLNWISTPQNALDYVYSNATIGNPNPVPLEVIYPVEIQKYDKLEISERLHNNPLSTIVFNYAAKGSSQELAVSDYLIRNNNDQETIAYDPAAAGMGSNAFDIEDYLVQTSGYVTGRGKTTLLSINYYPGDDLTSSEARQYKFEYGYNPSYSTIHKHQISKLASFPILRQSFVSASRAQRDDVNHSILPYSSSEYKGQINGSYTVSNYPNNLILTDELGYFYDATIVNNGRHAWSVSKVTVPLGGTVALEYENDQFDYTGDRQQWISKGSLVDDRLPVVSRYNELAIARSIVQDLLNQLYTNVPTASKKFLYRTFDMKMNGNLGGLRLKKRTTNDGINPAVVMNYSYGTGHYTSVPASYWQNYLSAFADFMATEHQRHSHESSLYHFSYGTVPGFYQTDFNTWFSEHAVNVRIDNTVGDNHYYEFIDEISVDNTKTRYAYNSASVSNNQRPYDTQKTRALKGYYLDNLIEVITNTVDESNVIRQISSTKYNSTGAQIQVLENFYTTTVVADKSIEYNAIVLPDKDFPVWGYHPSDNTLSIYTPNTPYTLTSANWPDYAFNPNITQANVANYVHATVLPYVSQVPSGIYISEVIDHNYNLSSGKQVSHQTSLTRLVEVKNTYKGVVSRKKYDYLANGLLKKETDFGSTKTITSNQTSIFVDEINTKEYVYAFEAYSPYTSLFANKNMLAQKAAVYTYAHSQSNYSNTDIIQASASLWQIDYTSQKAYPSSSYIWVGNVNTNGTIQNFQPFDFDPLASRDPHWELQSGVIAYNRYGQAKLTKQDLLYTRSVTGYNSEVNKASINLPNEFFDATYSGFEDLPSFYQITPVNGGYAYLQGNLTQAYCPNSLPNNTVPNYSRVFVNNSNNDFVVGDEVLIEGNSDALSCFTLAASNTIFRAVITSITQVSNPITTGEWNNPFAGFQCFAAANNGADLRNNGHVICFDQPLPANVKLLGSKITILKRQAYPVGQSTEEEQWYLKNADETRSFVTTNQKRTGERAYVLGSKNQSSNANQVTPLRPIYLPSSTCTTCSFNYMISAWLRNNKTCPVTNPNCSTVGLSTVRFKYEIWNETRTQLLASGNSSNLNSITSQWQYYEYEIPVTKQAQARWLDVYLENTTVSASAPNENIYVDDILIYPKGAKYAYTSHDKFLKSTSLTDVNDNTTKASYDAWGRPERDYDAQGNLLHQFSYFTSANLNLKHNYTEVKTWLDNALFNTQRTYLDGFGKTKQIQINNPGDNQRIVTETIEYDALGRQTKTYNRYALNGMNFSNKYDAAYSGRLQQLYGSSYAYIETVYKDEPGAQVYRRYKQKYNNEAAMYIQMDDIGSLASDISVPGGVSYSNNELIKGFIIDEDGNIATTWKDKLGRTIAIKMPLGESYTFNNAGAVQWNTGNFQYATTYYIYDLAGRNIKTIDPEGKPTEYAYNSAGRKISETSPDRGLTVFNYNDLGWPRFTRDANQKEQIDNNLAADQYTYNNYDAWGRVIEIGQVKVPVGNAVEFNNPALINNLNYPDNQTTGLEKHKAFILDGSKSNNAINRVIEERIFSDHQWNGSQFIPGSEDVTGYSYDDNGRIVLNTQQFSDLTVSYQFNYTYSRGGMLKSTKFIHSSNSSYNYQEEHVYDHLGRKLLSRSGQSNFALTTDVTYDYDVIGNVHVRKLAATGNTNNPYHEYITNTFNIRQQLTNQTALNFSFGLTYDRRDQIVKQIWQNRKLDNTSQTLPYQQHQFDYFYDSSKRLIGADYSQLSTTNNPFSSYPANILQTQNDFICQEDYPAYTNVLIEDVFSQVKSYTHATVVNNLLRYGGDTLLVDTSSLTSRLIIQANTIIDNVYNAETGLLTEDGNEAMAAILFKFTINSSDIDIANDYKSVCINTIKNKSLSISDKVAMLVLQADSIAEINYSGIYDRIYRTAALLIKQRLENGSTPDEDKLSSVEAFFDNLSVDLNTSQELAQIITNYALPLTCDMNVSNTSIFNPVSVFQNPVITTTRKYDSEYYYDKVGNFSSLSRYDDQSINTLQNYSYQSGKNQLTAVNFIGGNPGLAVYSYDKNGNLTEDLRSGNQTMQYNVFGRATEILRDNNDIIKYRYGVNDVRTVKILANGEREYSVGNVVVDENGKPKRYTFDCGFADFDANNIVVKKYNIEDWLGTVRFIIDEQGTAVSCRDHYAYGRKMPGRIYESDNEGKRYQFTKHQFDDESSYVFFGLRYLNDEICVFTSRDIDPNMNTSQTPYAYTSNNPINRFDPDGARDFYSMDGKYLGSDEWTAIDEVYVTTQEVFDKNTKNGVTNWSMIMVSAPTKSLGFTRQQFLDRIHWIYGEGGNVQSTGSQGNVAENYAYAMKNARTYGYHGEGFTEDQLYSAIMSSSGGSGRSHYLNGTSGSSQYDSFFDYLYGSANRGSDRTTLTVDKTKLNGTGLEGLQSIIRALINAELTPGLDPTRGATNWGGGQGNYDYYRRQFGGTENIISIVGVDGSIHNFFTLTKPGNKLIPTQSWISGQAIPTDY
jgi:RHS repeat-associated protein